MTVPAGAAVVNATWNSATDVPVIASSYTATGNTVDFTLNFAPPAGFTLTVVSNTGRPFISGTFDNVAQGQRVALSHNGITYNFVASYYGGSGNDLMLMWAGTRPIAWGSNGWNQLGNNNATGSISLPVYVVTAGTPLANRTILAFSSGYKHSLALCSDGSMASWGDSQNGQLGNNTDSYSLVPTAVTTAGTPLSGKTVVAISSGLFHNLALCNDGSMASWGYNGYGQLGNNSTTGSNVPVAVTTVGTPLSGRQVVGISAGAHHNLALCSDGALVTWGSNSYGALGNNSIVQSKLPVMVVTAGTPLQGRSVVAIAAGGMHNLALCSDGTLVAWGLNNEGELGITTPAFSLVPVAVPTAGTPLAGKTIVALAAGNYHSMVLCSDGTIVTWGDNDYGQLGNNSATDSKVPVAVIMTGLALTGKIVIGIAAGAYHSVATCSDGTVATWGYNVSGQLGNNSMTNSLVPVEVSTSTLAAGERFILAASGQNAYHNLALVPSPVPATKTLSATFVTGTTAVLNGTVNANGRTVAVSVDYGPDTTYGTNVAASPANVSGTADTAISVALTGLTPATTYHFRVNAMNSGDLPDGGDQTFTTANTYLSGLALDAASLSPAFNPTVTGYTAAVGAEVTGISVTPATADSNATVTVNGAVVASGTASPAMPLVAGNNSINVVVKAADQVSTMTYSVVVTRIVSGPLAVSFANGSDVPLNVNGLVATGSSVNFALGYAPVTGTTLTVVNNTSASFISGTFSNLAQGQLVELIYQGNPYHFMANYFGGTGNDLVLEWADTRGFAWGDYTSGRLGASIGGTGPLPLLTSGALTPLAVIRALAAGGAHSLALCWDGTVATWGSNDNGQLGSNSAGLPVYTPAAVSATNAGSALFRKNVVAIAAGSSHSLALCTDGTVAAWGSNSAGALGTPAVAFSTSTPQSVSTVSGVSALYGKSVTAISAGSIHNLALCSDGTLVAWGGNESGQLGNLSLSNAAAPVTVNTEQGTSALYGKTVIAISAGGSHSLALCSDGTMVAWGQNTYGQLGDNTTNSRLVPTAVNTTSGVSALYGKTVIAIAAGGQHSLALCSDGTVVAWGANYAGQLGDGFGTRGGGNGQSSPVPRLVNATGYSDLGGRFVRRIAAGAFHSVVQCSDQTLVAWGDDTFNQLGTQFDDPFSNMPQYVPIAVPRIYPGLGEYCMSLVSGPSSLHTLLLLGEPPPRLHTGDMDVVSVGSTSAVLSALVESMYGYAPTFFEYGLTTTYGSRIPGPNLNSSGLLTRKTITGLTPGTTYHYRVTGGTYSSQDVTFTTLTLQQDWRQQNFGSSANTGTAADTADYDGDGIPNLLEYALNLSPKAASKLPATTTTNGANFEYTYTRSTAAVNACAIFTVEWSDTLAAGSWSSSGVMQTVLSDDGMTQQVKAVIPINAAKAKFVHLSVTAPP